MTVELRGDLSGTGLKIGIVVARFNESVTSRLLDGAKAALARSQVRDEDITVAWVPGSFEVPVVARKMAGSKRHDAVICLGAVIKGETDHYHYIAAEAAKGVAEAGRSTGVPVIFGVLTTDTVEQAMERAGGGQGEYADLPREADKAYTYDSSAATGRGNSGFNAGVAAVEMANLMRVLDGQ